MKHLKLFESWTYDKIMNKFDDDKELDDVVGKYIRWKRGNEQKNIVVTRIYYEQNVLWVNYNFTESEGGGGYSTTFRIEDVKDFNEFAENPDARIEQEKYNL